MLGSALIGADLFGLGWRTVCLIDLPLGPSALLLGWRFLPESKARRTQDVDPLGIGLSTLGCCSWCGR
ncbi:hypothetical protein AB0D13_23715 [Streptomyces sp. NPDC048430]|uniref:hypothetical protein n=1 Tax=Streptomyces sp. NPDC048430 TaxID=3155388 RepID=UPI00343868B5